MQETEITVGYDGLTTLTSAANAFAEAEIERLAEAVIENFRDRAPSDTFSAITARHFFWTSIVGTYRKGLSTSTQVGMGLLLDRFHRHLTICYGYSSCLRL